VELADVGEGVSGALVISDVGENSGATDKSQTNDKKNKKNDKYE
jgi:hypothetical protein